MINLIMTMDKKKFISLIIFTAIIIFKLSLPDKIFAQACQPGSSAGCYPPAQAGDPCPGNRVCIYLSKQGGVCNCGIVPGGPTPTPTSPPAIPTPTLPPGTFPPPGWYAPDGTLCDRTNYHTYFTNADCTGQAGFVTENITPQSRCSIDGSGNCFKSAGPLFNSQANSYWKFDSQGCVIMTSPFTPVNAYTTLHICRWGIPPVSSINGSVTVSFVSPLQFERIYVWLTDTLNNYSRYFEIDKNTLTSGQPFPYFFNNLFPDRKYDIYVKAYGLGGVYLDYVIYDASCHASSCRKYPNQRIDFTLTFPQPPPGSSLNQVTNDLFLQQIEKWSQGQITALEMSLFIRQLSRVPSLQKETCDPRVPGGCSFP